MLKPINQHPADSIQEPTQQSPPPQVLHLPFRQNEWKGRQGAYHRRGRPKGQQQAHLLRLPETAPRIRPHAPPARIRVHPDLEDIKAIGVDEVTYSKGHKYITLIYQIDSGRKRLLSVIRDRDTQSLTSFFKTFGAERCAKIKVVCSDMWKPYLNVIAAMLPIALNVLDRFHIAKKLGEAIDEVRRQEVKQLAAEGYEPVLKNARYCFLKRACNLTIRQSTKLRELLKYDLKSMRALALKESVDAFWHYESPRWARWYLKKWCARAMRSRLDPMKKFVRTLRNHEDLLMNYFKAGKLYSSGIVEGLNLRINLCMRKAYGYRSFELLQISLFHTLGDLPEPKFTHKFC